MCRRVSPFNASHPGLWTLVIDRVETSQQGSLYIGAVNLGWTSPVMTQWCIV